MWDFSYFSFEIIIIIIIIFRLESFSNQLKGFHWCLSDNKSPQVLETLF